jgi:hypothetical protein
MAFTLKINGTPHEVDVDGFDEWLRRSQAGALIPHPPTEG